MRPNPQMRRSSYDHGVFEPRHLAAADQGSAWSQHRCAVAVAYFSEGASSLLPLAKGSRLVVNASERCVASGQTCPADLIKLVERGVAV